MGQANFSGGAFTVIPNGIVLRDLRRLTSRTQNETEREIDLPALSLSRYECGKPIPLAHLETLALYYKVSVKTLTNPESADFAAQLGSKLVALFEREGKQNGSGS